MAIQIPCNFDEPIHHLIHKVVTSEKWEGVFQHRRNYVMGTVEEYFDVLSALSDEFDIWPDILMMRLWWIINLPKLISWWLIISAILIKMLNLKLN